MIKTRPGVLSLLLLTSVVWPCFALAGSRAAPNIVEINRVTYQENLRGFWLGSCIANWTGLPTENARVSPPFFTDADWQTAAGHGGAVIDYALDNDPWGADDDTDIEYVYQHAIEKYENHVLTGEQISAEWQRHIGLPLLWVSNLAALSQMQNGALPPSTSLPENNPMWDMIDAQLTTEVFGALSPGRPDIALEMAHLPIRTTAYMHSEWAAEFYVIMYSLVGLVDQELSREEQVQWLAEQARRRLPEWSYIADMYDFVKREYENNPVSWERTRDKVYERYQVNSTAGYVYQYPWDSGINFASSIVSLLYGQGDFKKTIRIATLSGWDADNPTSTWGGLLGLLYGYQGLQAHFDKIDFSDTYWIERTRFDLPISHDTFTDMAQRGVEIVSSVVEKSMGGKIVGDTWVIPVKEPFFGKVAMDETTSTWITIEDNDSRWSYEGFEVLSEQWNASGATLASGNAGCTAEIAFEGIAVQYYAYRSPASGTVRILLDGLEQGAFNLATSNSPKGQYYVKIYEALGLPDTEHRLRIECDGNDRPKTIDMLSILQ